VKIEIHPEGKESRRQQQDDPEPAIAEKGRAFKKQGLQKESKCERNEVEYIISGEAAEESVARYITGFESVPVIKPDEQRHQHQDAPEIKSVESLSVISTDVSEKWKHVF